MIRRLFNGFVLSALLATPLFGQKEGQTSLASGLWDIPVAAVGVSDPLSPSSTRKPKPGFTTREGARQWDASTFVKALGATDISEAIYDIESSSLIVKSTPENLEAIGRVLAKAGLENAPTHIAIDLFVYECTLPAQPKDSFVVWPSYADLLKKDSGNFRLIDHVSGTASPEKQAVFRRGASIEAIAAKAKSVVSPDQHLIDTDLTFLWPGPSADRARPAVSFRTSFTTWENYPVVVHVSAPENTPGKYWAVAANVRLESSVNWTLESLARNSENGRSSRKIRTPSGSAPP